MFSLCETEKIRRTGRKKARMFVVYVEASVGICCFIPMRHRIRFAFSQCGKALTLSYSRAPPGGKPS